MTVRLKIDFVSDIVCPWCAIGLHALQSAARNVAEQVTLDWHFQPFELNPDMPAEGQDITEHLQQKYGASEDQLAATREQIRQRGAELGFVFQMGKRDRIYNTFDAHRLLHWAEDHGQQLALKQALLAAYFTEGQNPSDRNVLLAVVASVGLPVAEAEQVLASGQYADAVREAEQFWLQQGIHSVPAVIINDRYLIQGGQPVAAFENALRQIAAEING